MLQKVVRGLQILKLKMTLKLPLVQSFSRLAYKGKEATSRWSYTERTERRSRCRCAHMCSGPVALGCQKGTICSSATHQDPFKKKTTPPTKHLFNFSDKSQVEERELKSLSSSKKGLVQWFLSLPCPSLPPSFTGFILALIPVSLLTDYFILTLWLFCLVGGIFLSILFIKGAVQKQGPEWGFWWFPK